MDKTGKVFEVKLDGVKVCGLSKFAEGLASVGRRDGMACGNWGFIDKSGALVIDFQFDAIGEFSNGLAPVGFRDEQSQAPGARKVGYIDRSGRMVIEPKYEAAYPFSEGLARVVSGKNGPNGYIDTDGNLVIQDPAFDISRSQPFAEGLAAVSVQGRYGFIDKTGVLVIQPRFDHAEAFSGGLAHVRSGGKWGFIDRSGNWAIQPQFEDTLGFTGSLAAVKLNGSWRFIDKTGKTVAEIRGDLDRVISITEDVARVINLKARKWAYVDKTGRYIWDPQKLEPAAESGAAGGQPAAVPAGSGPQDTQAPKAVAGPPEKADARALSEAVLADLGSGNIAQLHAGSAEAFRTTVSQADLEGLPRTGAGRPNRDAAGSRRAAQSQQRRGSGQNQGQHGRPAPGRPDTRWDRRRRDRRRRADQAAAIDAALVGAVEHLARLFAPAGFTEKPRVPGHDLVFWPPIPDLR
jgi:hypothetical protein